MSDPYNEGPEATKARRRRNIALGTALIVFVLLIFIVTIIRLGGHALQA